MFNCVDVPAPGVIMPAVCSYQNATADYFVRFLELLKMLITVDERTKMNSVRLDNESFAILPLLSLLCSPVCGRQIAFEFRIVKF